MTARPFLQCTADRRRFIAAYAASILLHAALFLVLSFSLARNTRNTDFVSINIVSAESVGAAGDAQSAGDAARETASPRARPVALGPVGQSESTRENRTDSSPSVAAPRVDESDATAVAQAPASRPDAGVPGAVPAGPTGKPGGKAGAGDGAADGAEGAGAGDAAVNGVQGAAVGGSADGSGDQSAALASQVSAAIEARKFYPEAARRRGSEGVVQLRLHLSAGGALISAKLASSSGSTLLDRAALDLASSVFPVDNIARRELEMVMAVEYSLHH